MRHMSKILTSSLPEEKLVQFSNKKIKLRAARGTHESRAFTDQPAKKEDLVGKKGRRR